MKTAREMAGQGRQLWQERRQGVEECLDGLPAILPEEEHSVQLEVADVAAAMTMDDDDASTVLFPGLHPLAVPFVTGAPAEIASHIRRSGRIFHAAGEGAPLGQPGRADSVPAVALGGGGRPFGPGQREHQRALRAWCRLGRGSTIVAGHHAWTPSARITGGPYPNPTRGGCLPSCAVRTAP